MYEFVVYELLCTNLLDLKVVFKFSKILYLQKFLAEDPPSFPFIMWVFHIPLKPPETTSSSQIIS